MNKTLILGLDVGTTNCKITIFNIDNKTHFDVIREYKLYTPEPGWIEIDAEEMWKNILEGMKECIYKSGYNPKDVKAISYSVLGCAVVPIDKNGNTLYSFIEGWDSRDDGYKKYFDLFNDLIGEYKLFEITGNFLVYGSINKILWIRDNKKDIFKKVWKFLCAGDFITYRLTGEFAIDYSMASTMVISDIRKKDYSFEILDKCDLDKSLFADIFPAGKVVGQIKKEIAEITGLSEDTKVVTGSHDQTCAALGVGNIKEGIVSDGLGTVECIGLTVDKPIATQTMMQNKQPCYPHAVRNKYFTFGAQLTYGMMLRWYKDVFCQEEIKLARDNNKDVYDIIIENAAKSPPGARGIFILPYLRGSGTSLYPPLNMFSRCSIIGLNISHDKNDVSRAILEGVAFESKVIIDNLLKTGIKIDEMRATGGATKSDFWLQIRANIIDKKILVPKFKDAGLMGAIILACMGIGIFKSEEEAVKNLIEIEKEVYPQNKEIVDFYNSHFKVYKKIFPKLLPLYKDIKDLK
ncbi:MAG: FGGY family carbohydrate kinase [Actinobacteria bacterium]|nr:FGGY family carbohydrate kinase [Actinomycetota bacterium]